MPHPAQRRYAVYGTGHRARMYVHALLDTYASEAVPVAWCDTNEARMRHYDTLVAPAGHRPGHYHPDDLERMLAEEKVDVLVVCSPDRTHAQAVCTALRAGVDVVCEKPLTVDEDGLRAIRSAVEASDARLTVTFNYRYAPRNSALRQVIADGTVGRVLSVHFEWLLDTVHGADYFRRWHRDKTVSGGLAVHKATHHFDLVNWWLDDVPETVFALGALRFYGEEGAGRPPGERPARGRDAAPEDPFGFDMATDPHLRALYLDAEDRDGYVRDRDVFDAGITAEDTLNVLVGYRSGTSMSYALTAHSPWEGYRVCVNGSQGRAELEVVERAHVTAGDTARTLHSKHAPARPAVDPSATPSSPGAATAAVRANGSRLVVQRHWEEAREIEIEEGEGGHGGGDALLLNDVFVGSGDDPQRRRAGYPDGLRSVAVGIAVNRSLETHGPVRLADLGLPLP